MARRRPRANGILSLVIALAVVAVLSVIAARTYGAMGGVDAVGGAVTSDADGAAPAGPSIPVDVPAPTDTAATSAPDPQETVDAFAAEFSVLARADVAAAVDSYPRQSLIGPVSAFPTSSGTTISVDTSSGIFHACVAPTFEVRPGPCT